MWSQFTNVADRRTDRQTTCDRNTALCTKVHRAVKIMPKICQTAKANFSLPNAFEKCQIWVIWHFKMPVGNPARADCRNDNDDSDYKLRHHQWSKYDWRGGGALLDDPLSPSPFSSFFFPSWFIISYPSWSCTSLKKIWSALFVLNQCQLRPPGIPGNPASQKFEAGIPRNFSILGGNFREFRKFNFI